MIEYDSNFIKLGLGVNSNLLLSMLCQACKLKDFMMFTSEDIYKITGLTKRQQLPARAKLKKIGFVDEISSGKYRAVRFKVNYKQIEDELAKRRV